MYISSLTLKNFRNYKSEKIEFSPLTNLIYGNNAQGKTNILEAVYLFAHGRSHRAKADREMIRFGSEFMALETEFHDNTRDYKAELRLAKNGKTNTDGTIGARLYEGIYNVTVTRNGVSQSYKVTVDEDGEHTLDIDLSSTRFISDIKLMAGDGEVESLEKWDGAEPLNIDYTINEGYYESSRKNIYITAYGANGTLLGVRNITADRTGGHTQLPLQLSDKTKKIKFFVWDNGMIPANPMKEF